MGTKKEKILRFGDATLDNLLKIVNIKQIDDKSKFKEWFDFEYKINEEDDKFLNKMVKKHKFYLTHYNEQSLLAKFISPILNRVDFNTDDFRDWYEPKISCKIKDYIFRGEPDYFVAKGIRKPEIPLFFLQEFKPTKTTGYVDDQLLAQLITATEINTGKKIKGSYVIGRNWYFAILEKLKNYDYRYYISKSFDCLDIDDLRKIYTILQVVKLNYCK